MAHTRKDTFTKSGEYAKHLRRFGKQEQARKERRAGCRMLQKSESY